MKFFSKNRYAILSSVVLLLAAMALKGVLAQDPENEDVAPVQPEVSISANTEGNCTRDILTPIKRESRKFADFITLHFRSDKPASLLMDQAFLRYRYYREDLLAVLNEYFPAQGTLQAQEASGKTACRLVIEDELTVAKSVMKRHILENARSKKTTLLLDHYKDLNRQMESLQFQTAQLYGYLESFSRKLPCYVKSCTQQ